MGYLWCPADWPKGEQTKAVVRLERGKERGVIRLQARDLHLLSVLSVCLSLSPSLPGLLWSHGTGGFCARHTLSLAAALHLRSQG